MVQAKGEFFLWEVLKFQRGETILDKVPCEESQWTFFLALAMDWNRETGGMIGNSMAVHGELDLLFMFRSTSTCHDLGYPSSCRSVADRRPSVRDGLSSVSPIPRIPPSTRSIWIRLAVSSLPTVETARCPRYLGWSHTKDEPLLQGCMQLLTVAISAPMMMYEAWKIPQRVAVALHFPVSTTASLPSRIHTSPPPGCISFA